VHDWYLPLVFIAMLSSVCSVAVFARMSVSRIERAIVAEGRPRPCPWDGPSARAFWYAWAITLPIGRRKLADGRLIDVPLLRRHASWADRVRAWLLMAAVCSLLVTLLLGWFVVDRN